jgi:hypothetical protein
MRGVDVLANQGFGEATLLLVKGAMIDAAKGRKGTGKNGKTGKGSTRKGPAASST